MTASSNALIKKLQQRVASRNNLVGLEQSTEHPMEPPVSSKAVQKAEKRLGFALPDFLKRIYTEVGNGGFGPAYGLIAIGKSLPMHSGETLVSTYQEMLTQAKEHPVWHWPKRLLPIAVYGCGMYMCVDCAMPTLPVMLFDPNNLDDTEENEDAAMGWTNAFWSVGASLSKWLNDWLKNAPAKDPTWPARSWLRKRLWPRKPQYVKFFLESN